MRKRGAQAHSTRENPDCTALVVTANWKQQRFCECCERNKDEQGILVPIEHQYLVIFI